MLGRLYAAAFQRFRDRSQIEAALKAFAAGQAGTFGPHLRTDGNALWCDWCSVPIALVVCHDCHNSVRLDPIRAYMDDGVVTNKYRLWIYLSYLEAFRQGLAVVRGPEIARLQKLVADGKIEPCTSPDPSPKGRPRPTKTYH